nr:hypothetical protein [Trichoderma harzianum]
MSKQFDDQVLEELGLDPNAGRRLSTSCTRHAFALIPPKQRHTSLGHHHWHLLIATWGPLRLIQALETMRLSACWLRVQQVLVPATTRPALSLARQLPALRGPDTCRW